MENKIYQYSKLFVRYILITGNTYSNACSAYGAGVSIMTYGKCSNNRDLQCNHDNSCYSNEYCKAAEGTCGGNGRCTAKPTGCGMNFAPVCGCDGSTYSNECDAEASGVSVLYQGECTVNPSGCVPDDRPRPVRNGERFRFNLEGANAVCVDTNGNLYEYGQFNNVDNSSDCGDACVNNVSSDLSSALLGFDFHCANRICQCLYSSGTLNSQNRGAFDSYDTSLPGKGSISGTTPSQGFYAFKLVGAESEDAIITSA